MKRFKTNLKYIMFGGMALALTACADDSLSNDKDSNNGLNGDNTTLSTAKYTVGGGDQSRAWNYSNKGISTRGLDFQMPSYPTDEEINSKSLNSNLNDLYSGSEYYIIETGSSFQGDLNSPGKKPSTLYVKGSFKGKVNGDGWNIYILEGGSFEYTGENFASGVNVYNWGEFKSSGNFSLNTIPFYSAGDVNINGTFTFPSGAQYYCKEETVAKRLYINSGAKVESCAFIIGDEDNYPTPDAWGNVAGDAQGVIEFAGGNLDFHTSYIEAGYIKFNSNNGLHLSLENNGRINTKYLQVDPKQNDQKIVTLGTKAVVCAKEILLNQNFQQNEEKLLPNFGTGVALQDVEVIHENGNNNSPSDYDIPTSGGINNPDFSMKAEKCSPGYRDDTEPQPDPKPSLELITEVKSPTHDHDADKPGEVGPKPRRHLSATSLTFDGNGNIYASYHMRGGNWGNDTYDKDDIEGCIERWTFDGNEIKIGNWMWTNEFDFNHIILDEDNVITVGHKGGETEMEHNGHKYTDFGGIIGRLPSDFLNQNWDATDELTRDDFQYKYLTTEVPLMGDYENESGNVTNQKVDYTSAGDGNCVVRVGNEYFVATSAGYGKINASDFKRIKDEDGNVAFISTPGSAKYLVENNGQVKVLYLNDRAKDGSLQTTSFGATLATMSTSDFPFKGDTKGMKDDVTPVDGKNVIAINDGVVYACLSKGGLQIGEKVISFEDEENGIRSVNGVAVDNNYIYVANGSFLTVLDKSTHEKIVERKGNTKNVSANFVEVKEFNNVSYIFVAFGQDGIKVFQLKNPGK